MCTAFLMGCLFLILGVQNYFNWGYGEDDKRTEADIASDAERGRTQFILGLLMFTPGSYGVFMLFMAFVEAPGYDYSMVPSYDE